MKGFLNGPSETTKPRRQRALIKTEFTRPFCHRLCLALICDPVIVTAIVSLLNDGRPAHIAWFVVAIVIDAIQFMLSCRRRADMVQERLEGVTPFLADANVPAPVSLETLVFGSGASRDRFRPCAVFLSSSAASGPSCCQGGMSVLQVRWESLLSTTARYLRSAQQVMFSHGLYSPADAATFVAYFALRVAHCLSDYRQVGKNAAVGYRWLTLCHDVTISEGLA